MEQTMDGAPKPDAEAVVEATGAFSFTEITTWGESWPSAIEATVALKGNLLSLMERNRRRTVLYLPPVQVGRGLNPDRPRNVVMAVHLEGPEMGEG
mgnify:CR=1 FL=1